MDRCGAASGTEGAEGLKLSFEAPWLPVAPGLHFDSALHGVFQPYPLECGSLGQRAGGSQ